MSLEDSVKVGNAFYADSAWEKNTPKTIVIFHYRPKYHEAKSKEAGEPVYVQRVFIKKITPGDTLLAYDQPATQRDIEEFPDEYEAFMQKRAVQQTGIPLEKWDGLTEEQIPAFKALNIYTVEHLASLPDSAGAKIFGFVRIRKKAQEFLEARSKTGATEEMRLALADRDAKLNAQAEAMAAMQKQMDELMQKMQAPRKPGRPKKVVVTQ
jgi:hypothetical protein